MERKDVQANYKWRTSDVFASDEKWEKAFSALEKSVDFAKYRGTLNTAENILAYFKAEEEFTIKFLKIYLYAFLKHDEDVRETKYASYLGKVMSLNTRLAAETSFSTPELTALPDEMLEGFLKDGRFKDYDYMLKRLIARKKYVLSEKEERILALSGEPMEVANDVFEMLDNAELDLPSVEYEGKEVKLSHGLYSVVMSGKDRAKRKEVYEKYYSAYKKILGTLAVTYAGNVKTDIFYKEARGFESCIQRAMF